MHGTWLVPFKGRHSSLAIELNFLWKNQNFYLMDNHRAAAWCWSHELDPRTPHAIFHIDAHYDTAGAAEHILQEKPEPSSLSLDQYLTASHEDAGASIPIYRWDNYISIYNYYYSSSITRWKFATHALGTPPSFAHDSVTPEALLQTFESLVNSNERWIVNLDLDYFRSKDGERFAAAQRLELLKIIARVFLEKKCTVLTVCLSPECCGGWTESENLCYALTDEMQLHFRLP